MLSDRSLDKSFDKPFDHGLGTWWLNVQDPTEEEIACLVKVLSIDPLTGEDIMNQVPIGKVEWLGRYYTVCFGLFGTTETIRRPGTRQPRVYAVVFPDGVMSFMFDSITDGRCSIRQTRDLVGYVASGSDWICPALMYAFWVAVLRILVSF